MLPSPTSRPFHRIDTLQEDASGAAVIDPILAQHGVEHAIWRELQSAPGVHFSSLTVRRMPNGVCLQGVMEADYGVRVLDVDNLVRRVADVEDVVNQLLVRESHCPPRLPR